MTKKLIIATYLIFFDIFNMDLPKYFVTNPMHGSIEKSLLKDECQRRYESKLLEIREKILFLKYIREQVQTTKLKNVFSLP
jgi:hypothetical protein